MEAAKQELEVERGLVEPELTNLESLLNEDPINVLEIRICYNYIQDRFHSFHRALEAYYKKLNDAKKYEDYKNERKKESELAKRRTRVEYMCSPHLENRSTGSGGGGGSASGSNTGNIDYRMRLPRRELPKFSGDVTEWLGFWAAFQEIHLDPGMPDAEKFHYLQQSTVPDSPARKVLDSFPMSKANYKLAADALKDTFGRENILIKVYIRSLLNLVVENSKDKPNMKFQDLVTLLTGQLRNLDMLGVTQDKCGLLLYPIVESCVPSNVLKDWLKSSEYKEDIDVFMEFLRSEVRRELETGLAHSAFNLKESTKQEKKKDAKSESGKSKTKNVPSVSSFMNQVNPDKDKCGFCEGSHPTTECVKAMSWTVESRREAIKKSKELLCFRCLKKGHAAKKCHGQVKCFLCGGRHHSLVCERFDKPSEAKPKSHDGNQDPDSSRANNSAGTEEKISSLSNCVGSPLVPLQTLRLIAYGPNGKMKEIRAILDSGNQRSYITKELAEYLDLRPVGEESYAHELFGGGVTPVFKYKNVKVVVSDLKCKDKCEFEVSCKDVISNNVARPIKGSWIKDFLKRGIQFTDAASYETGVDLLLGNKLVHKVLTGEKCSLPYGPGALNTRWGWVLSGEIPVEQRKLTSSLLVTSLMVVDRPLSELWELDTIGIHDSASTQTRQELDQITQKHFNETVTRQSDGRYQVDLPFIAGTKDHLPQNFEIAEKRLQSTTRKLKSSNFLEAYDRVLKQWEGENMIEVVSDYGGSSPAHYLPHRAVIKLTSSTTPIRPVFDASCKERGKLSLNECLEKGPNTLELIPSILTRFRLNKVGVISDIRKAFQQIEVSPAHRPYLRFLWWENLDCKKLKIYQHKRVVFGVSSSPFLLGATIIHHLQQSPPAYRQTSEILQQSLYVDNNVTSLPSYEAARKFKDESTQLLLPAHFELRDWAMGPAVEEMHLPVLGLLWNTRRDTLTLDLTAVLELINRPATQRNLLSLAHSIFDPLGWISPFTLTAKLLLRECHKAKLGWDKEMEEELAKKYSSWVSQIPLLSEVHIPRYVFYDTATSTSIHVFCDASCYAYAAAIFIRSIVNGKVLVNLLEAKAKVSPIKNVSIPRLELLSCLIAARLTKNLMMTLGNPAITVSFWSDSATALAWIHGTGPWATFVHNRVVEIRELTGSFQWRHIPGTSNPADLPSRGCSTKKLLELTWWEGPKWLYLDEEHWPSSNVQPIEEEVKKEMKKSVVSLLSYDHAEEPLNSLLKFRGYDKMLRVISYMLRFVENVRDPDPKPSGHVNAANPLFTFDEIQRAELYLIRFIQNSDLDLKKVQKLRPFKDNDDIIRITTRLSHEDTTAFKNPILLPDKNEFVKRMIMKQHYVMNHAGVHCVLATLRENFWIINGRRVVRGVVTSCVVCRRYLAKRILVPEAPLPSVRTATSVPFSTTGVDMAGPLILRGGQKVYIALFTCSVYRGVHLELLEGLSTDLFLEAFRKFISRRGRPNTVYSDNGLNFVGASRILKEINWEEVQKYATINKILWRFNPPSAAWWGGWWERLIGLVKELLIRNLGKRSVNEKQLTILLIEIKNVLNSRPLTYMSEDSKDPIPLTPNHFLRNSALSFLPEMDVRDGGSIRKAYQKLQNLRESLRSRFRREYLGQLLHHSHLKKVELNVGDVVLLEQDNIKRVEWPIAVVTEVLPGRDGITRTYRVRSKNGVFIRAAQRLYPLEVQDKSSTDTVAE